MIADLKAVKIPVPITFDLTMWDIECLMDSAYGYIGYWAHLASNKNNLPAWERTLVETATGKRFKLSLDRIIKGLGICAKKYPHHFSDFISENGDAITADVIIQCATLGDIVYS